MNSEDIKFINAFDKNEISKFMTYYKSFFNYIFPLYYSMLKYYSYSFYNELFFLILEYLGLIMFIFQPPVSYAN